LSKHLGALDFASHFGVGPEGVSAEVRNVIESSNLGLGELDQMARDQVLLACLKRIRDDKQIVGDPSRTAVWEKGWRENLDSFSNSGSEGSLVPKFLRAGQPIRWEGEFYTPDAPNFEVQYFDVLREYIFSIFAEKGIQEIHEFGAGTGWNLVHAGKRFGPTVRLVGSDFVPSSVELMRSVSSTLGIPIESRLFDMLNPDLSYEFREPSKSVVFTSGALEQLAGDLEPMIDFIIARKPSLVVNVEPASETYNLDSLVDYLGHWFQSKRGYSSGLIDLLREREAAGKVNVEKIKRLGFGSMMMEGFNLFIWSPAR